MWVNFVEEEDSWVTYGNLSVNLESHEVQFLDESYGTLVNLNSVINSNRVSSVVVLSNCKKNVMTIESLCDESDIVDQHLSKLPVKYHEIGKKQLFKGFKKYGSCDLSKASCLKQHLREELVDSVFYSQDRDLTKKILDILDYI